MANKYVKREYYQGKLVAYMKKNEAILRYKLCRIEKKHLTATLQIKSTYSTFNPEKLNDEINELEQKIDELVSNILYNDPNAKITNKVIENLLFIDNIDEKEDTDKQGRQIILYDFDIYIRNRENTIRQEQAENGQEVSKGQIPSLKDFKSTRNALEDYEYDNKCLLLLKDIDDAFVDKFRTFLVNKRVHSEEHKYKTNGGLSNPTINKRLDCLSAFIRHFYGDIARAKEIIKHKERVESSEIIRLTKEELVEFAEKRFNDNWETVIQDYFVFLCLTGLRYSDLIRIRKSNFLNLKTQPLLALFTKKTTKFAEIGLTSRAISIAEKYNFQFTNYTNQAFNRELKLLLKKPLEKHRATNPHKRSLS